MIDGLLLAFASGFGFLLLLALIRSGFVPSDVFTGRSVSFSNKLHKLRSCCAYGGQFGPESITGKVTERPPGDGTSEVTASVCTKELSSG